ncbi:hypothetical protein GCM10022243_65580 [Saccharothrix violaceirubra]|uniref:Uncharacterized protein n=1 Tax=Saccharothrix violaceirubra TaxID=413306 RepID=A0A7W7TBW7_9PSEU|nr:hypothetical protein [Saccharothrix violaceirubra]MBB4968955.1 hypothetical protein [Saccharothrix violaceirubra]
MKKGCLVNVVLFAVGAAFGTVLTAIVAVLLFLPSTSLISAHDPAGDLPGMYVKREGDDLEVWLGQTADHGYVVPIPEGWDDHPVLTRVEGGVELRFEKGGRIFVPESYYLHGR